MSLDMTSFDSALKQHYTNDAVLNMVYRDNPLLAMIPKMEEFGGRDLPIPLIYGNPQGRSATFSQAQTRGGVTHSNLKDFRLLRVKDYSIATIDNETLEASKGNANAFLEAATVEIDGAINSLSRSIAISLYRSGFGEIGQVANTSYSTTVLTLTNTDDITNFEVGQVLCFASTLNASVLRGSSVKTLNVVAVDRSAGTVTLSGNISTVDTNTVATNDYIFVYGDRQDSATPTALKLSGLEGWIPASSPSATLFFNVDRTSDVTRLAGQRKNGASVPIEECLIDGAAQVSREGQKLTHYFCNYAKYAELEKALGSKVQYIDMQVTAEVAFRGILINTPRGPVRVVADQNCPSNRIFGLNMDYLKLYSLGKAVRVIDTDGLQMLRQATSDGVEVRYGMYGQMGIRGPAAFINIQV